MNDALTRDEVLLLMAGDPGKLLSLFGIGREEFMTTCAGLMIEGLKKEVGGTLGALFPLNQKQAEFISGLSRVALMNNEYVDGGNRKNTWTVEQALKARDGRTVNKHVHEAAEDKIKRLERELEQARKEAA